MNKFPERFSLPARNLAHQTAAAAAGREITVRECILVDGSPSMLETDWEPTRLHGAITAAIALAQASYRCNPQNEVAAVVFNETARVVRSFCGEAHLHDLSRHLAAITVAPCTNITAGLERAYQLFVGAPTSGHCERVIHLLTDGQHNTGPSPLPVAEELKREGVHIDVVSIGSERSVDADLLSRIASEWPDGIKKSSQN